MAKISFEKFDQTPGEGWRALEAVGKFKEAGDVIKAYIAENSNIQNEIYRAQISLLWFHAGQMYAMCDEKEMALAAFRNADMNDALVEMLGPTASAYLHATIAFLSGDRNVVAQKLNEILKTPLKDYPPGRFVFIPGRVHDMYENPNVTYADICNMSFKLPPLSGENIWHKVSADELDKNSENLQKIAERYNIDFKRSPSKKEKES